jgi:ArsR family transcriptional regulator, repressor of sdpIR and other operons
MSTVFKALSDPTRRRVLELLRKRPLSAGELADHFDVSKPTMSAHFAVLREAGLIASEKHGKSVVYELQMSVLEDALLGFAQVFGLKLQDDKQPKPKRLGREVSPS